MDTKELLDHVRIRFDHETAKQVLKEKYLAKMLFAYNGGMWQAGPTLITLLEAIPSDNAVILDLYENPIKICPKELQQLAFSRWQELMNAWLEEYEHYQNKR